VSSVSLDAKADLSGISTAARVAGNAWCDLTDHRGISLRREDGNEMADDFTVSAAMTALTNTGLSGLVLTKIRDRILVRTEPVDRAAYLDGVAKAIEVMHQASAEHPQDPALTLRDELDDADLADPVVQRTVQAISTVRPAVVLPPRLGSPGGEVPGLHIPLTSPLVSIEKVIDQPSVRIVSRKQGWLGSLRRIRPTLEIDVDNGTLAYVDPEHARQSIADIASDAKPLSSAVLAQPMDAAVLRKSGVDLFRHGLTDVNAPLAYRLDAAINPTTADAIAHWHQHVNTATSALRKYTEFALGAQARDIANADTRNGLVDVLAGVVDERPVITVGDQDDRPDPLNIEERVLSAKYTGSRFQPPITMMAWIDLPGHLDPAAQHDPVTVDTGEPVVIEMQNQGFDTADTTWMTVWVPPRRPSMKVACQFTFKGTDHESITVYARQRGQVIGHVHFDQFTLATSVSASALTRPEPVFDLLINVDEDRRVSLIDSDGSNLNTVYGKRLRVTDKSGTKLDQAIINLGSLAPDEATFDRKFRGLANQVAEALPEPLINHLRLIEPKDILIQHPAELAFPFEMAMLVLPSGENRMLGEWHRVTRWIAETNTTPRNTIHSAHKAAFVSDDETLSEFRNQRDRHVTMLQTRCPTTTYDDLAPVFAEVLTMPEYSLIDIVTHMVVNGEETGLKIGDERLTPSDFYAEFVTFATRAPLVFLNACDSAKASSGVFGATSFPYALIKNNVPSIVASVIPVEPALALRFDDYLFGELANGNTLGQAISQARQKLNDDEEIGYVPARRRAAAIAYCAYGSPRSKIDFPVIQPN
jgi:hypothetical protein